MLILNMVRLMLATAGLAALAGALGPFEGMAQQLLPWDKAGHVAAFYTLGLLGFAACPGVRRIELVAGLVLCGGGIELAQALVGRDCSLLDVVADACGVLAAYLPSHLEVVRARLRLPRRWPAPARR